MLRRFLNSLRYAFFRQHEAVRQLILFNVAVFILIGILKTFLWLFSSEVFYASVLRELRLSAYLPFLKVRPWTLITYMFLHEDFWHIFMNMLVLYFIGRIFSDFQPANRIWLTYLLGGFTGGLFYVAAYNIFPQLNFYIWSAQVLGASAGVMAIVVAAGMLTPDYTLFIPLIGGVRLKYIVYFFIVLDVISIPKGNAGGHITHLGGAAIGILYIALLKSGRDIYKPILNLQESVRKIFQRPKKKNTYHTAKKKSERETPKDVQKELDRILDKISKSGYENLTKEEKEFLFRASGNPSRESRDKP